MNYEFQLLLAHLAKGQAHNGVAQRPSSVRPSVQCQPFRLNDSSTRINKSVSTKFGRKHA